MNKLFKLSYFIILLHQIIVGHQEPAEKMQYVSFDSDEKISESEYLGEGFLQGTLVETMKGYVLIEQIVVGDYLVGLEGVQEVLSVHKGKVDRYVRLLMSNGEYVYAAMHQNFYLNDETLFPAAGLCPGSRLLNELYIVDNEFIHEPCNSYCLTTEHHAFFIYPETLVHNFNPVVIGVLGSYVIGTVEISNVVNVMLGAIVPLSWYVTEYFRSKIVYNYEFSEEDSKLTIEQLCLQNSNVVQQARSYFDTKRRLLNNLHQDLIKVKNDVSAFVRPNYNYTFDFSFGLLSQYKPALYNLLGMIPLVSEMALSLANKEKLMKARQVELDKLQQDIFDTHLTLVLHITELIDRRDLARQQLCDVCDSVNTDVHLWNENLYNIPVDIALAHYKTQFLWKEMFDNLEWKIKELKYVMSYYEKLKNHFFMTKTTNFIDVFNKQTSINKANLEQIESRNATWWSNMYNIEKFLTRHNLLTEQLVKQYQFTAQQYRAEKDKNSIVFAQKKQDDIKDQIKKESEEEKKGGGGGGPEKDPKDPPEILGYFKNVFTHAFTGKKGHLTDIPTNRILILNMARDINNFLIKDEFGNYWYAKILDNGEQLWAWARNGLIKDCGINEIPRVVTRYGLCKDPFM